MIDRLIHYKVIKQINEIFSNARDLDSALKNGLNAIYETLDLDVAIIWFKKPNENILQPFFWYGKYDFTSNSHSISEGLISDCFNNCEPIKILNYTKGDDIYSEQDFKDSEIASLMYAPIESGDECIGCMQFVSLNKQKPITEETADVCEIMSMVLGMELLENDFISSPFSFEKILIKTDNICKSYENGDIVTHVLRGVNLNVYESEFLVLLGESGCGKSTFLNIIGGLDYADSGSIIFKDKEVSNLDKNDMTIYRRNNLGYIFQSYNLMPNLSAIQNLDMVAELVDNPIDSTQALEMVGLLDKKDSFPSKLSGGQQQRVSIARALVKNPKVILADEPTAELDYETSIEVLSVFEKINKAGTTLVMVTHNEEIAKMANRVLRFRNGQVYEMTINKQPAKASTLLW